MDGPLSREQRGIIGTKAGIIRAYAVKRQPEDNRWDEDLIKGVRGAPLQPDPSRLGLSVPIKVNCDPPAEEEREVLERGQETMGRQIRRVKITQDMSRMYGY